MLKDSAPQLSVVVTVHNSGDFLEKCLASLEHQDLERLEIIIVNDSSPDVRDEEIIHQFVRGNKKAKYWKNEQNLGTGRSREIGIELATGEYIGFLDSDDYVEPYAYSLLYSNAVKYAADIVVANFTNVDGWSLDVANNKPPVSYQVEILSGQDLFESQILRINRPYYLRVDWWNKIYRRELFVKNKVTLPHVVRNEGTMSMIMSLLAERCVIVDCPLFYTTARSESVCRAFRTKNIADTVQSTLHFRSWLVKLGVFKRYREAFIRFFFFVVFDHNLKLISRLGREARVTNAKLLLDTLRSDGTIWRDFLSYLNLRDKSVARLVYGTISTGSFSWEIFKLIKSTEFIDRKSSSRRMRYGSSGIRCVPDVTIVTIIKNLINEGRRAFFDEMVASVKSQSFPRERIEHIVVDGASDDGTVGYLDKLFKEGQIDFWISEPDSGIYNAMNKGSLLAHGKYVLFLNSDDYLHAAALERLYAALQSSGAAYAFANAVKVDENGRHVGSHIGDINKVFFGTPYCHQTLLCRRDIFRKVYFDEKYRITMWSYAYDLYMNNYQHVYVPEVVASFRVGGVSTDMKYQEKFKKEQDEIKSNLIVPKLPLTLEEYEYLNHSFRRWDTSRFDVDLSIVIDRLSDSNDSFVKQFLSAYLSLAPKELLNEALVHYNVINRAA
jgi:glycosyltransferase involved in cell wall biosynthesis